MSPARSRTPSGLESLAAYSIGPKLRTLRNGRGLTLARLGAETKLSTALLSKLESELMIPTLQTLTKICRVYGVDLSYFFSGPGHHSMAITRSAHIKREGRGQPTAKQIPLHCASTNSRLIARIVEMPSGVMLNVSDSTAPTELIAYVLEGTLRTTNLGEPELLQTGDCMVLDTDETVIWTAENSRCRVLVVSANWPGSHRLQSA